MRFGRLSEAEIKSERAGKITAVNVVLGQTVSAGQIIAQLENASERAALLQAEGAYEAILASVAQSDISVNEAEIRLDNAKQSIHNTAQNSYNTINNVVLSTLDQFYSNPTSGVVSLRIGGVGNTEFLNSERVAFRSMLADWKSKIITTESAEEELAFNREIKAYSERVLTVTNILLPLLSDDRSVKGYSDSEIIALRQSLSAAQSQITATISQIDVSYTELKNAKESLEKTLLVTNGNEDTVSASDAQVKQALGSLRAVQASYEKTLLRSPLYGTINSLDVKIGQFVGSFEKVATVANNNSLEIVSFVSDKQLENILVGKKVLVDGEIDGVITVIAPAIDSATKKTEIRIAIEDQELQNGKTVRVALLLENDKEKEDGVITLPLTAVKFIGTESFIFTVKDNILESKQISLGEVRGAFVEVLSGLEKDEIFVLDVRGRSLGEKVQILN
ncbi:MAG: HlyD family efflux transporter periplasmic adaptor subunit [Candidatus Paceibacterota bacterium]